MPKVLLVDADADGRESLERALAGAGYEIAVAPSGAAAIDALGRGRPDLVVTQARFGDGDASQLVLLSRSIPGLRPVPFLLLAGTDEATAVAAAAAGAERICEGHVSNAALLANVADLIGGGSPPAPAPAVRVRSDPAPGPPPAPAPAPAFQGSLGVMDLPALAQAISMGTKTGRLELSLSVGEGIVEFDRGLPVHAEFAGGRGEAAFAALVWASQAPGGTFCFAPALPGGARTAPRTIHRSVERLLLDVAAWLDEERLGIGAAEPSAGRAARE